MLKEIKTPATISAFSYLADTQGCGTIRIIYPFLLLNHLRIEGYRINAQFINFFVPEPRYYRNFTFVQFQRAATHRHLELVDYFLLNIRNQSKVPVIYEIDDLLTDIPEWNYAHDYYNQYVDPIKKIMSKVDGIVTSTEFLRLVYKKHNENVSVIPNHLPKFVWGEITPRHDKLLPTPRKTRILYQGSENHFCKAIYAEKKGRKGGDFGDGLIDFIRKTTDKYQWVLMGGRPLELVDLIDSGEIEYHKWHNIFAYPNYVKALDIDIGIAPLMNNVFNMSKSNIKNLEYVALGIPGVYSDIEPYAHCYMKAKTDDEFIDKIEKLVDNPDLRKLTFEYDYGKVKDQLWWEENDNVRKFIDTYLAMFGKCMKNG